MEEHISVTPKQPRKFSRLSLSNHKRKRHHRRRPEKSNNDNNELRNEGCDLNSQIHSHRNGSETIEKQGQNQTVVVSGET